MKKISIVIASFIIIACSYKNNRLSFVIDNKETCIPSNYIVKESGPGFPSGDYDSKGGGFDYSILFSAREVAQNIPKYKSSINIDGSEQLQIVYVMLNNLNETYLITKPKILIPLKTSPNLFRKGDIAINSTIYKKAGSLYSIWGSCSNFSANKENFYCKRSMPVNGIKMTYEIHNTNLKFYKEVDNFILNKLNNWQCQS